MSRGLFKFPEDIVGRLNFLWTLKCTSLQILCCLSLLCTLVRDRKNIDKSKSGMCDNTPYGLTIRDFLLRSTKYSSAGIQVDLSNKMNMSRIVND